MSSIFEKLLGINWKTTLAGITAIIAAVGRIVVAYRTKDFEAIFTDAQFVLQTVVTLLIGFGLISAKDKAVHGAGDAATRIE